MEGEPFEVTGDNGITARGIVDVHRDPKAPCFDPKRGYYKQPRYEDAHFDYFNTREACTIDQNALGNAIQDAFKSASAGSLGRHLPLLRHLERRLIPGSATLSLRVVTLLVALIVSANTVSSSHAQQFAEDQSTAAQKSIDVAEITEKSAAQCSVRLQGFIEELEGVLGSAHSVYPVQQLFGEYFPLTGCDPGAVLSLCLKSRYCRDASVEPNTMVILFDSQRDDPHWGLVVQFAIDRRSGDSELPFVKVKI